MKKNTRIFSALLVPMILFVCVWQGVLAESKMRAVINEPPPPFIAGDVDRSGSLNIEDSLLTMRASMNISTLNEIEFLCADVDFDDHIIATDALVILRSSIGLERIRLNPKIVFLNTLFNQMGEPYIYGAEGPDSFDCSGLVYFCLNRAGYNIGRWTAAAYANNEDWFRVDTVGELHVGDLMFFKTATDVNISHTGVYIGNNMLIHASRSQEQVVIATITDWFVTNFAWGRRIQF